VLGRRQSDDGRGLLGEVGLGKAREAIAHSTTWPQFKKSGPARTGKGSSALFMDSAIYNPALCIVDERRDWITMSKADWPEKRLGGRPDIDGR